MGLVNKVVPFEDLEAEQVQWAREMLRLSPTALRLMTRRRFNAATGLRRHSTAGGRRDASVLHLR